MATVPSEFRVGNLMSIDPVTIESNAAVAEAAERLLKTHRISGLPVVDGGATVGVISQTDIMIARSSCPGCRQAVWICSSARRA